LVARPKPPFLFNSAKKEKKEAKKRKKQIQIQKQRQYIYSRYFDFFFRLSAFIGIYRSFSAFFTGF